MLPSGWVLNVADGINDAGQIAGYGTYNGNSLGFVLTLPQALPGDANLDGKVDINDLTIVLANYGQTGMTWTQGEFTGDGTVDINDLTIVLAHYGQSVGIVRRRHRRRAGTREPGYVRYGRHCPLAPPPRKA